MRLVPPRAVPLAAQDKTARRRAAAHRRRTRPAQRPLAPRSAPSRVFNSLTAGIEARFAASTSGFDRGRLILAAGALLVVMLLGGSLLALVLGETRTLRGP